MERLYRDNRLNAIHEGTHGIQGLDLFGRKVVMEDGAALSVFEEEIRKSIDDARDSETLASFGSELELALDRFKATTQHLIDARSKNLRLALADATLYLDTFGHVVIAWMWLKQACVAAAARSSAGAADASFYAGKLSACQYFFRRELPKVHLQADLLERLDDTASGMDIDAF